MKRCPPPRMYNLHLQVYLFVWPLNFDTLWRRNAASFFEAIVGWTGQILTGSDVPECCLVFLCVILSPNWEVFEVKALHWRAKRGSLECRIALLSPPSFYCTNDRTTCSSVRVRMSHMTEVVEEDTGMSARSWGAMWGWGVEWEDVAVFVWNCLVW